MKLKDKKIIGLNVKKIRKELKLTQEEFAEELNIHPQFLSQVENGKNGLSIDNAVKICEKSKCSSSYLFQGVIKTSEDIGGKFELLNSKNKVIISKMIDLLLETN